MSLIQPVWEAALSTLNAIEFQTTIHDGNIQIHETYRALFKITQALPQIQSITEEDIASEIESHQFENANCH
jgi:hypothetical protein